MDDGVSEQDQPFIQGDRQCGSSKSVSAVSTQRLARLRQTSIAALTGAGYGRRRRDDRSLPGAGDQGYPPEDLVQWQGFVDHQWFELERFAAATADLPAVFALGVAIAHQGPRYNCAAIVSGGQIDGLVPKEKLPTYSIYYEGRTISRGSAGIDEEHRGVPFGDFIFQYDFGTVAFEVCEDLWSPDGPMKRRTMLERSLFAISPRPCTGLVSHRPGASWSRLARPIISARLHT